MSAPSGNDTAVSLDAARRRLALAQAARANATREEIEARGIRPNVHQIVHHMNRTPSHSFKRARINHSAARKIYEDEDGEENDDTEDDGDDEGTEEDDEEEFEQQWQAILAEGGLQGADMFALAEFRQIARQRMRMMKKTTAKWHSLSRPPKKDRFDLLASLCSCTELIVEVCKHMRPLDIVHLYSVSKDFHYTINEHMRSSIFAWASHMAPTAARIYSSPVYCRWFIQDPCRRRVTVDDQELSKTQPGQAKVEGQPPLNGNEGEIRLIPGLLWLQMAVNREIRVRDILACLARRGHRMPEGTHQTLKKIWLIMDAATTQARMMLLNNPDFFSNEDLYIAQLFMVKLILAFNDPVFGPQSSMLMRLMLGQRGLSPLWALLRGLKYRTIAEIRQLKLRYDVGPDQLQDENLPAVHGVDIDRLGVIHFEGWGTGPDHLMRPDELIPLEAARRQLDLDICVEEMMIYGHVDFATGNSLVPSLEEMYMSDDDLPPACKGWKPLKHELIHSGCGNVPFEQGMWQPKHARKARWKSLTGEEKEMILEAEQEEMDEVKELNGARWKHDIVWANLAKLTTEAMSTKKLKAKYKVLSPSPGELESRLAQFARPQRLRLASNYTDPGPDLDPDAMDIDVDVNNTVSARPLTTAQSYPDLALRPAPPALDPDDPSTIPDEDLVLDQIPAAEVNRIINSFLPPRSFRDDSDSGSSDEDAYTNNTNNNDQHTTPTQPRPAVDEEDDDDDRTETDPDLESNTDSETETEYEEDPDNADADDEEEEEEEAARAAMHRLPPIPIYNVDPTLVLHPPATALSENTDEMLLAQADAEYSDDVGGEGEEEEEEEVDGWGRAMDGGGRVSKGRRVSKGGRQRQRQRSGQGQEDGDTVMMLMGGGVGDDAEVGVQEGEGGEEDGEDDLDWDEFLRNPDAFVVEAGLVVPPEEEEKDGDETEEDVEDDDMEIDGEDDGTEDGSEEEDDINFLMGGLQVGQAPEGYQQVAQQMAEAQDTNGLDLAEYMADEDVGEDEHTKKLRDWFRPW